MFPRQPSDYGARLTVTFRIQSGVALGGQRMRQRDGYGDGDLMSLSTHYNDAIDAFEAIELPAAPGSQEQLTAALLRRRSVLPSRRAVLFPQAQSDSFVPEDLASWFTARGFHFYVADLRPAEFRHVAAGPGHRASSHRASARRGSTRRAGMHRGGWHQSSKDLQASFAGLDAASSYLREADGIDSLIVSGHGAGASTAALWCDARRDRKPAEALILTDPDFGRGGGRPLDIPCPVLIVSGTGEDEDSAAQERRMQAVPVFGLGAHVTFLRLAGAPDSLDAAGPAGPPAAHDASRRLFFDEMGRWLGAYMYGQVRDQLL